MPSGRQSLVRPLRFLSSFHTKGTTVYLTFFISVGLLFHLNSVIQFSLALSNILMITDFKRQFSFFLTKQNAKKANLGTVSSKPRRCHQGVHSTPWGRQPDALHFVVCEPQSLELTYLLIYFWSSRHCSALRARFGQGDRYSVMSWKMGFYLPRTQSRGREKGYLVIVAQHRKGCDGEAQGKPSPDSVPGGKIRRGFQGKPGNPGLCWGRVRTRAGDWEWGWPPQWVEK